MKNRKILLVLLFAFVFLCGLSINVSAITKKPIEMIFSSPGEDASTEVGISWHAQATQCTLLYTEATDTAFTKASKMVVRGTKSEVNYYEKNDLGVYYLYQVDLKNLEPDTKYAYRIQTQSGISNVQYFKTAGLGGQFNFLLLSDVHASNSNSGITVSGGTEGGYLKKLIESAERFTADEGGVDMVAFAGDFVRYGANYSNWQLYNNSYISTNYSIALTMGNHEYYDADHNGTTYTAWTDAMVNNPDNNIEGYYQDYWFIYNNVLFIAFDNIHTPKKDVEVWAENVLKQNQGKYQYCVVYHHFPDFTEGNATGAHCDYGSFDLYKVWDKYNVDVVVGADSHVYVRTKQLYNGRPSTVEGQGTVYVTTTNICSGGVSVIDSSNKWYEKVGDGAAAGGLLFNVTPTSMTMKLFNTTTEIVDSFVFPARNEFVIREELLNEVEGSLEYINIDNSTDGYVVASQQLKSISNNIKIYDGETLLAESNPLAAHNSSIKVENLAQNQVKELKAVITYTNGSVHEVKFIANTKAYCGYITNFRAGISNGQISLTWEGRNLTSDVANILIYRNDEKLSTLSTDATSTSFDVRSDEDTAKYYLELVDNEGNVLHRYSCFYVAYGDLNYDGVVNDSDIDIVSREVFDPYLTLNLLNLADVDRDGLATYKDIMLIWRHISKGSPLSNDEYVVTFKNIDGTILSKQVVKYGESATAPENPTLEGYAFASWSDDYNYITQDVTIYAIFAK